MNGFIFRRAGVLLSAVLVFNSFGMFVNATDDASESLSFEEEIILSDDSCDVPCDDYIEDEEPDDPADYDAGEEYYQEPEEYYDEELFSEEDIFEEYPEEITDPDYVPEEAADEEEAVPQQRHKSDSYEQEEYFTVRYVSEECGVIDLPVDNNYYKKGDTVMVSYIEPMKEGYSFWGWSFTGDSSCVYSGGYSFEIEEDVVLYATWAVDEYFFENQYAGRYDNASNPIVASINTYVKSLKGRFNPTYKYNGVVKSIQCCALTDQIWENALGIGRYSTPNNYKIIDSKKKLGKTDIYKFLKANNAQPGDIIWCHDPVSAKKYNITHYMILMGYDKNGITITDGYERNGKGIVWKNNQRVSYTGDHAKYFSGKCYIRLYHVTKTNL